MILPNQIKAARALIGWKQSDLSKHSGISTVAIKNIESGHCNARNSSIEKIKSAFFNSGIEFIDPENENVNGGPGVRFR